MMVIVFASSVVAASHPRLPTSAADWASFSKAEREAALGYEWGILQRSLHDGTADVHQLDRTDSGSLVQRDGLAALTITYDYNCPIQWVDQIGGAWFRGGGWTDASNQVYYIAASRVGKQGVFLRDGVTVGNWYNEKYNDPSAHAESWSGYSWRWSFESIHWVNKGWHGIRPTSGGSWLLGPDASCIVSIQR
jgi:hypothetical protein